MKLEVLLCHECAAMFNLVACLSYSTEAHADYRLYVSAEPAATRESHIIPQGILESSIKITNEPPTGRFCHHLSVDV